VDFDKDELVAKPALIASVLDPRHKHLRLFAPREREAAKAKLLESFATVKVATEADENEPGNGATGGDETASDSGVCCYPSWSRMTPPGQCHDDYSTPQQANDPETEVGTYMRDNPPSLDTNPVDWWKANQTHLPRLATLARHYLCVPGTLVPSQQVFSDGPWSADDSCS